MKTLFIALSTIIFNNVNAQIGTWRLDSMLLISSFDMNDGTKEIISSKQKLSNQEHNISIGTLDNPIIWRFNVDGSSYLYYTKDGISRPELAFKYKLVGNILKFFTVDSNEYYNYEIIVYLDPKLLIISRTGTGGIGLYYYYSRID